METFAKLFERFLVFVYHCFDRIDIQGYLPLLTRPSTLCTSFAMCTANTRSPPKCWLGAPWNTEVGSPATLATTKSRH